MAASLPSFPEIDLTDPDNFVAGVPHHWFRKLRREAPVYWHEEREGPGFWVISKYDDLKAISRSPQVFCSSQGTNIETLPPEDMAQMQLIMLNMDPPKHVKFRRLVQRGFTPNRVVRMEAQTRERARAIVDAIAERGECDFVNDIAAELPLQVIADLMGVPQEDRAKRLFPKATLVVFDSTAAQFNAVRTGRATAAQLDEPIARWYVSQHDDVQVTEDWITPPTNNAVFTKLGSLENAEKTAMSEVELATTQETTKSL